MLRIIRIIFPVITFFFVCMFLSNCDEDNPTKSVNPTDYVIYFYDTGYDQYLAYHTASGMIDTVSIPYAPNREFAVSADGQILYIPSGDIVAVIDANTLETITELPYPAYEVAVSPDGQKIALLGGYLYILNTSDFAVVFADSNLHYVENGIFSKDSKTFYFSTRTSHLNYISLNGTVELTRQIISTINNKFAVWSVIPSSSGNKLYLYLKHYEEEYLFSFSVYDKVLNSIIFTDSLIPGEGNIAMTNDERYLIYTNPGRNDFTYPDPPFTFKIFNTGTLQIEDEISSILTSNKNDTVYFSVNEICLTPDNKLLLGTGLLEYDEVIICNLRKKEIEQTLSLGGYRYLKRPTCQLQLKE